MVYNPGHAAWMLLGICDSCPDTTRLKDNLVTVMDDNMIGSVVFKKRISVDRSTLETVTKPAMSLSNHSVRNQNSFSHILS